MGSVTVVHYYYCNRSGFFISESTGQRHLKSQGSSKLHFHCTAGMTVKRHVQEKSVTVDICHTHYGHSPKLGHLRLPEAERLRIAGQLSQGVAFERVLDDIRDSVQSKFTRIHLTTRKDVLNIERAFGLRRVERHSNDSVSVGAWIEEFRSRGEDNPVLLYKPQGGSQPQKCDGLNDDDFALVLQTPLQKEIMQKLGPNRVVCIDATHKTNGYDFPLITVLVVDEFGEGFPVAWFLSNREDHILLMNCYQCLRENVGEIVPAWFMSDDAEQYYSAWVAVFGPGPHKLLCTWHVDRAWRGNLNVIGNKEVEAQVYHTLRLLLEETDTPTFEILLQKAVDQLNLSKTTSDFGKYFCQYYVYRKQEWAACYRKAASLNTNMYVEGFHHVLKYTYLKGKVNKRVDKCIHALLKIVRDKAFDRLIKLEKGKSTERIRIIMKRHRTSKEMDINVVTKCSDMSWIVKSSDGKREYYVTKETEVCPVNCFMRCKDCNICIHTYTCNCPDALIHNTICKHIHLVVQCTTNTQNSGDQLHTQAHHSDSPVAVGEDAILHDVQQKDTTDSIIELRKRVHSKLAIITTQINQCTTASTLSAAETHLNFAINIIRAMHSTPPNIVMLPSREPSNKNIQPQRPFHSTKKKSKKPTVRISKPTVQQKESLCNALLDSGSNASIYTTGGIMSKLNKYTTCNLSITL